MRERILKRHNMFALIEETSIETVKAKIQHFYKETRPVIGKFEEKGLVRLIDSSGPFQQIYRQVKGLFYKEFQMRAKKEL